MGRGTVGDSFSWLDGNSEITYRLPDGQVQTYFLWLGEQADYQRPIRIYSQKGKPLFQGNYQKDGLFLFSDTGEIYFGEIEVSFNKDNPYENFQPSYYEMARIVTGDGVVSRGEGWSALLALLLFAMTAIDIRWPLLGFQLSHMWWVEDPQPTDLYIFCQRVSWVVMPGIGIVLLLISIW
ncbi:hypothetical protein [Youxingia wuxianensis]|uniref:hypothetical protein n=1 Tax=Youxingia wuxianensis TaxID=2763678 RepID=UPI0021CCBA1A|nr:hypothetical protein [Youxingia wuxianensis]